jgi:hypothetical protein
MPRLDLGISFQEIRGRLWDFRLKSSRQLLLGDAKIKSWHDGRVERITEWEGPALPVGPSHSVKSKSALSWIRPA